MTESWETEYVQLLFNTFGPRYLDILHQVKLRGYVSKEKAD